MQKNCKKKFLENKNVPDRLIESVKDESRTNKYNKSTTQSAVPP